MDAEAAVVGAVRQRDLGVHLTRGAPGRPHALEQRPVVVAEVGHAGVEGVHRGRLGPLGRPDRGPAGGVAGLRRQPAAAVAGGRRRVARPVPGAGLRPGVDRQLAAGVVAGRADGDLDLPDRVVVEDQRRLQHQLVQGGAAQLAARGQRHLGQRDAGHHDRVQHHVVTGPGLVRLGDPAGEEPLVPVADRDRGGQHRVLHPALPGRGRVARPGRRGQPVAGALEGVGGQRHGTGAGAGVVGRPVDGHAGDVGFGQRGDEPRQSAFVPPQRADHARRGRRRSPRPPWSAPGAATSPGSSPRRSSSSARTAGSKPTRLRRFPYQYAASSAAVSTKPPVAVE